MLSPERRARADLNAAAVIALALVVAFTTIWLRSDSFGTTSVTANSALPQGDTATAVPDTLSPIWQADSAATSSPISVGGVVVTADTGAVIGRDPASGDEVWRYTRDIPLCGVVGAWNSAVAVYRDERGCSQVTALDGGTGARTAQRSSDADASVIVSADGTYVSSMGPRRIELWRSDLVRTLEYGRVDAAVNPKKQPRGGCELLDAASSSTRVSVLENCPGEVADRLTVMNPSPEDSQEPEEYRSTVLEDLEPGAEGARILAVTGETTAVYLPPGPGLGPRIGIYDGQGQETGIYPLSGPTPSASITATSSSTVTWWTGSQVIALSARELTPRWTFSEALGPGVVTAGRLLVPVADGIAVLDLATGAAERTIPVDRPEDVVAPITLAVSGEVVLEQRGETVVALRAP